MNLRKTVDLGFSPIVKKTNGFRVSPPRLRTRAELNLDMLDIGEPTPSVDYEPTEEEYEAAMGEQEVEQEPPVPMTQEEYDAQNQRREAINAQWTRNYQQAAEIAQTAYRWDTRTATTATTPSIPDEAYHRYITGTIPTRR